MRRDKIIRPRFPSGVMVAAAVASPAGLLDGLVAWYEFDEVSGTRADSTSNHNDLEEDGGTVGRIAGAVGAGYAADTPGSGPGLRLFDNTTLDFTAGLTVAFWIKFNTSITNNDIFLSKVGVGFEFRFLIIDGVVYFQTFDVDSNSYTVLANTTLSPDIWYFVAATADNSHLKISINDGVQEQANQTVGITHGNNPLRIFPNGTLGDKAIDQLGLWSKALTPDEILQLYKNGDGLTYAEL